MKLLPFLFILIACQSQPSKKTGQKLGRVNDSNNTVLMDTSVKRVVSQEMKNRFHLPLRKWKKMVPKFYFDNRFETARGVPLYREENSLPIITVVTMPENLVKKDTEDSGSINDSPWYAFKVGVLGKKTREVLIELSPALGEPARYMPWMSLDQGKNWQKLKTVEQLIDGKWTKSSKSQVGFRSRFRLRLRPGREVLVSAQPTHSPLHIKNWVQSKIERKSFIKAIDLGELSGFLMSENGKLDRDTLIVIGGMHPPEVTGRRGLEYFVNHMVGEGQTAKLFRKRFNLLVVPLLNEKGIALGHWRHNESGIDLNRDWGVYGFNYAATQTVKEAIEKLKDRGARFVGFVDFHSTYSLKAYVPDVQSEFMDCIAQRIRGLSKAWEKWEMTKLSLKKYSSVGAMWAANELRVPSVVLEFPDHFNDGELREFAHSISHIFMQRLLEPGLCR